MVQYFLMKRILFLLQPRLIRIPKLINRIVNFSHDCAAAKGTGGQVVEQEIELGAKNIQAQSACREKHCQTL